MHYQIDKIAYYIRKLGWDELSLEFGLDAVRSNAKLEGIHEIVSFMHIVW